MIIKKADDKTRRLALLAAIKEWAEQVVKKHRSATP